MIAAAGCQAAPKVKHNPSGPQPGYLTKNRLQGVGDNDNGDRLHGRHGIGGPSKDLMSHPVNDGDGGSWGLRAGPLAVVFCLESIAGSLEPFPEEFYLSGTGSLFPGYELRGTVLCDTERCVAGNAASWAKADARRCMPLGPNRRRGKNQEGERGKGAEAEKGVLSILAGERKEGQR